jgi:hypothetical protein
VQDFPELSRILTLIDKLNAPSGNHAPVEIKQLGTVEAQGRHFPIHSFVFGSDDKTLPVFGLFGGVHGLERIGTQAVVAFLESFVEQLSWDADLAERLRNVRLVSIPLINPAGMFLGTRSNGNGVDLMRNSPVEALVKPKWLIGGHRITPKLPWYRGPATPQPRMEREAQILVDFVKEEIFPARSALVLDVHSGFGLLDRLWYPYAKTTEPFPRLREVEAFKQLLDTSYPNHVYLVEPQSLSYTTHGDLWDYLYDEHRAQYGDSGPLFLPWTLEMGSWVWVRKNPIQFFSSKGIFNPIKAHRQRRALRRHLPLMDFFLRAAKNHQSWLALKK